MEVPSKQKYKRRKTRKIRDEIRKRLRGVLTNNMNGHNKDILNLNNISRCNINEQITSKRLTLKLFNKTVISETITRPSSSGIEKTIDEKVIYNPNGDKINTHRYTHKTSCQVPNGQNKINNASKCNFLSCENKNLVIKSPKVLMEFSSRSIQVERQNTVHRTTMFSPLKPATDEEDCIPQGINDTNSFCTSSDKSGQCLYEKFMNDLPQYLKENFPTLMEEGNVNENIMFLKQRYLKVCHQQIENDCIKYCNNKNVIPDPKHHIDSIIQNPMDYIEMGMSWQMSVNKNQNTFSSSNSSSSSQFELHNSNIFVQDSPEYVYFPHKLNQ